MNEVGQPKRIQSLQRGMDVINFLSENGSSSLSDLRTATGLSNATLRRILTTFEDRGWVRRLLREGRYELPHSFADIMGSGKSGHPLSEIASPHMTRLQKQIGWTSDIAICPAPGKIEILETTRLNSMFAPNRSVYGLRPSMVQSAMGRAYAAFCSDEELDIHLATLKKSGTRTERQWIESGRFSEIIKETRNLGYGERESDYWTIPVDFGPEVAAIAVPIRTDKAIFGSLSCLWVKGALSGGRAKNDIFEALKITATDIVENVHSISTETRDLTFFEQHNAK